MTRPLITATSTATVSDAVDLMNTAAVHHLLVVTPQGKLEAVVSLRELLSYLPWEADQEDSCELCLEGVMNPDPWSATSDCSIADVSRTLRDTRFGCLPIVDDGHLLGIVTMTDLLRAFLQSTSVQLPRLSMRASIREYMSVVSPRVSPGDSVAHALGVFVDSNPSTLLVVQSEAPIGVLCLSDLVHALHVPRFQGIDGERARLLERPVFELMTRGVISIDASKEVSHAAEFLAQQQVHSLIVFDESEAIGTFGPREVLKAAGSLRVPGQLRDIMTNVVFEIDCRETLRSGLRFIESAGVRGLIVRDGGHPVGIFGQREALAAANSPLETPVEDLMSTRIVCLPENTPNYRAAQQAGSLGVEQILVTLEGDSCGLASATDFLHLLASGTRS